MSDRLFSTWPASRAWTPEELCELSRAGYRGVQITDFVELDPFFINLLRHAAAARLRVRWRGHVPSELISRLRHLSPPYHATGPAWRRPGLAGLTVRYGPGFLVVEDRRSGRYQRSIIRATDGRHSLLKDEGVRRATQLDRVLAEEGLGIVMTGWAVSLPIHSA